jgi:hypothetical protein
MGFAPDEEFDRQVEILVGKGYPGLLGQRREAFTELVAPLRSIIPASLEPPTPARVPFVLVIVAPAHHTMPLTARRGKPGLADFDPEDLARFAPIPTVRAPAGRAYVLLDVDRGAQTRNVRPTDALEMITAQGRTPLTVEEGIAFITAFPDSLERNNCFWMAASRCGDKRVPALWISKGAPKLGWCWAGNPHTWLGSASCAARISPER